MANALRTNHEHASDAIHIEAKTATETRKV